ncbi:MAG: Two-component transcriptional response regulator, LuxR family, partial [uncultured Frankineae bacterium]
ARHVPARGASARRRRRAEHPGAALGEPALRRVRGGDGHERRRRAQPGPRVRARPAGPRRDDARPGRLRGRLHPARPGRPGAGPVPHGQGRDGGPGAGAHAGRGRLRHQALQPRGGRRPHPLGPAAHLRPRSGERAGADVRAPGVRRPRPGRRHARGVGGRPGGRAVSHGVQPAALLPAEPRARAEQAADPGARVELRLRRRRQRRGVLRLLPAQEGRPLAAAHAAHRARCGLRAAAAQGASRV